MKQLFEIDLHDYDESDTVFRRPSARAIIFDDVGKIALVYSRKRIIINSLVAEFMMMKIGFRL